MTNCVQAGQLLTWFDQRLVRDTPCSGFLPNSDQSFAACDDEVIQLWDRVSGVDQQIVQQTANIHHLCPTRQNLCALVKPVWRRDYASHLATANARGNDKARKMWLGDSRLKFTKYVSAQ